MKPTNRYSENYKGQYQKAPMPHGCLYLNNCGSRWVTNDMRFVLVMPNGQRRPRVADYWSSLGNFGTVGYRVNGKRHEAFPKAHDGSETASQCKEEPNCLPHVFHKE